MSTDEKNTLQVETPQASATVDVVLPCWMDKLEYAEEIHGMGSPEWIEAFLNPATCLLPDGHSGKHCFIPDDEIEVTFAT